MKKEWTRDYATGAFIRYANRGCPTVEEYRQEVQADVYRRCALLPPNVIVVKSEAAILARRPLIEDFEAVARTVRHFQENDQDLIARAIVAIYKGLPEDRPASKKEITERVRRFSCDHYISESTLYRGLKQARLLFARFRGITIGVSGDHFVF